MSQVQPLSNRLPPDEAGAGARWIVLQFLLQAVSGVFSLRVLQLTAVGLLVAEAGVWACFGFSSETASVAITAPAIESSSLDPREMLSTAWASQVGFWWSLVSPFWTAPESLAYGVQQGLAGVWRLVVWSLFGVAIARVAAMHLTLNERPTATAALSRSTGGLFGQAVGPACVLAIVGLLAGAVWVLEAVSHAPAVGLVVALALPLVILLAVGAALLAIGLAFGVPLMWASHAVERPDPYDAVSCGFAYVFQRPLRLAAYAAQALAVGAGAGAIVLFATRVSAAFLGGWMIALVAPDEPTGITAAASHLIRFWLVLFAYLPVVFHAAYFWFATVAVYLLMRRDIDEKQASEVYLDAT